MIELKLFEMYHLKEMSFSAELFLSCSILQLTFYAVGTAYQRKHGYVLLSQQVYHIGALLLGLAALLLLNEDLLINNSLSSNDFIINDYLSFATKFVIVLTSLFFLLIVKTSYPRFPVFLFRFIFSCFLSWRASLSLALLYHTSSLSSSR